MEKPGKNEGLALYRVNANVRRLGGLGRSSSGFVRVCPVLSRLVPSWCRMRMSRVSNSRWPLPRPSDRLEKSQPTSERSRIGCCSSLAPSRFTFRQCQLGHRDCEAIELLLVSDSSSLIGHYVLMVADFDIGISDSPRFVLLASGSLPAASLLTPNSQLLAFPLCCPTRSAKSVRICRANRRASAN